MTPTKSKLVRSCCSILVSYAIVTRYIAAQLVRDIAEQEIPPRCPRQGCGILIPDFDGCSALACACGQDFCGWCFATFTHSHLCHNHVKACPYNLNPGVLWPPQPHPQMWNKVMRELARMRIAKRIDAINVVWFQKEVHTKLKQRYPELQMADFGTVQSDGFRPRPERGTHLQFEDGISVLIAMGIADRNRAQQVLEATQGNLVNATNILLAITD
jgi:NACalpha-BTF3-like transcription factor